MIHHPPIVATIVVPRPKSGTSGLLATVDGQPRLFPSLEAVFRAAVQLLEEPPAGRDRQTIQPRRKPS